MKVAMVPDAAASVGVARPRTITPITAKMINPMGSRRFTVRISLFPERGVRDRVVRCAGRVEPGRSG